MVSFSFGQTEFKNLLKGKLKEKSGLNFIRKIIIDEIYKGII